MFKDVLVIDDIFDDPDSVVATASSIPFAPPSLTDNWRGLRTEDLSENNIGKALFNNIFDQVFYKNNLDFTKVNFNYNGKIYFHKTSSSIEQDNNWWHKDSSIFAGVIYLNNRPPDNTGTAIGVSPTDIIEIENRFNRLVVYKSRLFHRPMSGFSHGNDHRLTLTFFINELNLNLLYKGYK